MAEVDRIQVQGLCRFSYPANLEAFQTRHASMEERRAALYAAERLEQRLTWFEHVALPSVRAQSNDDFTLHLLLGSDFPEPYRSRLLDLVADVAQIRPVFRDTGQHRKVYRALLREARNPNADVVAEFRLDDDDAVAVNFVAQIRRNFRRLGTLFEPAGRLAIDQGKGVLLTVGDHDVACAGVLTHCWAPGLTVYLRPGDTASVMDFPHQKVWMRMPTVSLTDQIMFVRGAHTSNDSPISTRGTGQFKLEPEDAPEILLRRFAIDLAAFKAALAGMPDQG